MFAAIMMLCSVQLGYANDPVPTFVSLHKQVALGNETLYCNNPENVLVLRTNGEYACVREANAEKLGWEIVKTEFVQIDETKQVQYNHHELWQDIADHLYANVIPEDYEQALIEAGLNEESIKAFFEAYPELVQSTDVDTTQSSSEIQETSSDDAQPKVIIVSARSEQPYDDEDVPYNGFSDTSPRRPPPVSYEEKIADGYRQIFGVDSSGNIILDTPLIRAPPHDLRIDIVDWVPRYVPDGQELKAIEWTSAEITGGIFESAHYWFAPTTSILNKTSTSYEFFDGHGIYFYIKKDTEIMSPERIAQYQSQFMEYGDVGMTLNGTRAVAIDGEPENQTPSVIEYDNGPYSIHLTSYRYHLDELTNMINSMPKWEEWK